MLINIAACRLVGLTTARKENIQEPLLSNFFANEHAPMATNPRATIQELLEEVFPFWYILRLYRVDERHKLVSISQRVTMSAQKLKDLHC
jgi:hypothetical protein